MVLVYRKILIRLEPFMIIIPEQNLKGPKTGIYKDIVI